MNSTEQVTSIVREWAEVFMRRSGRDFKRFMDATGLSFSQLNILMRLFHRGHFGVSEIGERMGFTNAAASQAVDRLVQMGYVERTEDSRDRRAKRLELTGKGSKLISEGIEARGKWIEAITKSLTPEQQAMIVSSLTLLTEAARQTEE